MGRRRLIVCTAWALLALITAAMLNDAAIRRGVTYPLRTDGDCDEERIAGVFDRARRLRALACWAAR